MRRKLLKRRLRKKKRRKRKRKRRKKRRNKHETGKRTGADIRYSTRENKSMFRDIHSSIRLFSLTDVIMRCNF
jgi:hypothetical protein